MTPERNCLLCRSFHRASTEGNEEAAYGDCRLLPPVIVVVSDEPVTMYPQVDDSCSCGQWEAAQ